MKKAENNRISEFSLMMNSNAWKEMERWAQEECERSMRKIDSIDIDAVNVNHICEQRGFRKGMMNFLKHASEVAAGR